MSDIPETFDGKYYDRHYFQTPEGKKYRAADGSIHGWSYESSDGEFLGAMPIAKAWKEVFEPSNLLDVGAGRGTFIAYARDAGIEAEGFDFSEWAISDEGRYPRCKAEWLSFHDATEPWSYDDDSFDLVVALDFFEHIYEEDIGFVISEMHRVAKKYMFLQIAIAGDGFKRPEEEGSLLKKGEPVPNGHEGLAVAGHVTVQKEAWWYDRLEHDDWMVRRDMVQHFCSLVKPAILQNWLLNSIIIMELIE